MCSSRLSFLVITSLAPFLTALRDLSWVHSNSFSRILAEMFVQQSSSTHPPLLLLLFPRLLSPKLRTLNSLSIFSFHSQSSVRRLRRAALAALRFCGGPNGASGGTKSPIGSPEKPPNVLLGVEGVNGSHSACGIGGGRAGSAEADL